MDIRTREILESLPLPAARSRLAPHGELILEMRRRGRTFREILSVLKERCGVMVSISTLHDFVKQEGRNRKKSQPNRHLPPRPPEPSSQPAPAEPACSSEDASLTGSILPDVRKRIDALKKRPTASESERPIFDYDPDLPLQLPPKK
jgi:hypothetical protein